MPRKGPVLRDVTRQVALMLWVATVGIAGGLLVMYASDAWRSEADEVGSLAPAHLMPYLSVVAVGCAVAAGALMSFALHGPAGRTVWGPGLALGAAGGIAALAAMPADRTWHAAFGVDALSWSPPHLLSVLGTVTVTVAALATTSRFGGVARIGLGGGLLGLTQVLLTEYDIDAPQFTEALYLPLLVGTGVGCAWLIHHTVGQRFAVSWAVACYLAFRVLVFVTLSLFGLSGPALPVGLVGLVVVDLAHRRLTRLRWPLAGAAVVLLQVIASAVGMSPMVLAPTLASAVAVLVVLLLAASLLVFRLVPVVVVVGVLVGMSVSGAPAARAHAPGGGTEVGVTDITVTGNGAGSLTLAVTPLRGVSSADMRGARLVARRADHTVTGGALHAVRAAYVGSISVPERGLWFVYIELGQGRRMEAWRSVDYGTVGLTEQRRAVYLPREPESPPAAEWVSGVLLYGVGSALMMWTWLLVRGRRAGRREADTPGE
jgi:hypothetical protein